MFQAHCCVWTHHVWVSVSLPQRLPSRRQGWFGRRGCLPTQVSLRSLLFMSFFSISFLEEPSLTWSLRACSRGSTPESSISRWAETRQLEINSLRSVIMISTCYYYYHLVIIIITLFTVQGSLMNAIDLERAKVMQ